MESKIQSLALFKGLNTLQFFWVEKLTKRLKNIWFLRNAKKTSQKVVRTNVNYDFNKKCSMGQDRRLIWGPCLHRLFVWLNFTLEMKWKLEYEVSKRMLFRQYGRTGPWWWLQCIKTIQISLSYLLPWCPSLAQVPSNRQTLVVFRQQPYYIFLF